MGELKHKYSTTRESGGGGGEPSSDFLSRFLGLGAEDSVCSLSEWTNKRPLKNNGAAFLKACTRLLI